MRAAGTVFLLSVAAACKPGLDYNSRVTPDSMVGQWSCPNGVTVSFALDGTAASSKTASSRGPLGVQEDANVFVDLGGRRSWRVAKAKGQPVLFRQWREADPSADDPHCRHVADR